MQSQTAYIENGLFQSWFFFKILANYEEFFKDLGMFYCFSLHIFFLCLFNISPTLTFDSNDTPSVLTFFEHAEADFVLDVTRILIYIMLGIASLIFVLVATKRIIMITETENIKRALLAGKENLVNQKNNHRLANNPREKTKRFFSIMR